MSVEVKVPALPESIADAVVAHWHKQSGDAVKRDENLVDLETDKVILEVPAVADGRLTEVRFEEGATVTPDQVLAVIEEAGNADAGARSDRSEASATEASRPQASLRQSAAPATETVEPGYPGQEPEAGRAISPSARKLMADNDVDESKVAGSGRNGRVLKEDVLAYLRERDEAWQRKAPRQEQAQHEPARPEPPEMRSPAPEPEAPQPVQPGLPSGEGRIEKRVPMTRLRARIAERLLDAQHNAAILTTFNEVNMKPIMELRNRYKEKFEKEYGVKLGFMSFFVGASVEALKKFPAVNASIDGNDIVYHGYFDIGVAVSGPSGLVVPVLRGAETMSLAEIEQAIIALAGKARDNRLSLEEITGGTFTISNGGIFGSMLSTPILNPPQSAILGMHAIKERPMVVDGEVVVLPMMYLALSYDHRIIDGREAVQFLVTIRDMLEDPSRMLLGI